MDSAQKLEEFRRAIPEGSFWAGGKFWRAFLDILIADRVRVAPSGNIDEVPTMKGRFWRAQAGGASTPTVIRPWSLYYAPFLGSGDPPANQHLKIMVRPGEISDGVNPWLPANSNQVFQVPSNCTDGYKLWLEAPADTNGVFTGYPTIHGGLDLPSGLTLDANADGAPPPVSYRMIAIVTSTEFAVELDKAIICYDENLSCIPVVTNQGYDVERRRVWLPNATALTGIT